MSDVMCKNMLVVAMTLLLAMVWAAKVDAQTVQNAGQYYPLIIATVDPVTGQQKRHTVYVPLEVANNMAVGAAVQASANAAANAASASANSGYIPAQPVAQQVSSTSSANVLPKGALPSNPWSQQGGMIVSSPAYMQNAAMPATANVATVQSNASKASSTNPRDMALPTFVGQNTTFNTAMGQEMIAPEINKTNMLSMAQHLRKIGYIVPDSLDEAIRNAPEKTRVYLVESMAKIQNAGSSSSDSPMFKAIGKISNDLEANYGFSFENILDNSMRILDAR